jgi:hypothetical protein
VRHLGDAFGQRATGHAGHDRVGQEKLEVLAGGRGQRFLAGPGLNGGIAILAQDARGDLQHRRLVIDDKDRRRVFAGAGCSAR